MEYKFQDYNIENHNIIFGCNNEDNIFVYIPFADDTPQCIKNKLNELINRSMNEYERLGTWDGILQQAHMPNPNELLLNARMEICYDLNLGVKYYLAITITDLELKSDAAGIEINEDILVSSSSGLYNEFVAYCRHQLEELLFPVS